MTAEHQAAYRGVRERLTALCSGLDDETAGRFAPATPDWTVKDIVAHLAGVLADIRDGNLDGVGTDPWTAKHVADRRGASLADCLAEWTETADLIEPQIPNFPPVASLQLTSDAFTHEQDIRGAVDQPGGRDSDAAAVALESFALGLSGRVEGAGLGLTVRTGGRTWSTGDGGATLAAEPFELIRAISGRRSRDQITAFDWDGDPEPYLEVFSQFEIRPDPLVE